MRRPERSVAMTGDLHKDLSRHLLRDHEQEDLCLVTWRPSTGAERTTHLLHKPVLPQPGERRVHGTATVTGDYVFRAAEHAATSGCGIALVHSHPLGAGYQAMSAADFDAERSYAGLAFEITGLPLVGLTLAGDGTWSSRSWEFEPSGPVTPIAAQSVRVVGDSLAVSWNPLLRPPPVPQDTQIRTVSTWGPTLQADLARRRACVVGAGSIGLDVIVRLAASGVEHIVVIDPDIVKLHNLDRLIGATIEDAHVGLSKVKLAAREAIRNGTAPGLRIDAIQASVDEPDAYAAALDCDIIFCCVDRPWPRAVLNHLAYADLIPVLDGGIAIDTFADGRLRSATWRAHVLRPGRPCAVCNRQLDPALIALDRDGLLHDPSYINGSALHTSQPAGQNVAVLSIGAAGLLLAAYTSFSVAPGGFGEPGPLQYSLSTHSLEILSASTIDDCAYEAETGRGDARTPLVPMAARGSATRDALGRTPPRYPPR